jgi:hypothetical protein
MFLVESDIFRWALLQETSFLEKGETKENGNTNVRVYRGRRKWN